MAFGTCGHDQTVQVEDFHAPIPGTEATWTAIRAQDARTLLGSVPAPPQHSLDEAEVSQWIETVGLKPGIAME